MGTIKLTVNELVAALTLCGYEEVASQVINEQGLVQNEFEFTRFIDQAERLLKEKGYWDDDSDTNLVKGIEDLLRLLVESTKKVRCVTIEKKKVLLIHSLNEKSSLLQEVSGNEHTFSFHQNDWFYSSILAAHFGLKLTDKNVGKLQPIQLSDEMFDELHMAEPAILNQMIQDDGLNPTLRLFLADFIRNEQELDNISFMVSNFVSDESKIDQVAFLLVSKEMIWHINYENVENHVIMIEPIAVTTYFDKIERTVTDFFSK